MAKLSSSGAEPTVFDPSESGDYVGCAKPFNAVSMPMRLDIQLKIADNVKTVFPRHEARCCLNCLHCRNITIYEDDEVEFYACDEAYPDVFDAEHWAHVMPTHVCRAFMGVTERGI